MEQIQQHEWGLSQFSPDINIHYCKHCLVDRLTAEEATVLYRTNDTWNSQEPACITRPANTDDQNLRKATDDTNNRNKGG